MSNEPKYMPIRLPDGSDDDAGESTRFIPSGSPRRESGQREEEEEENKSPRWWPPLSSASRGSRSWAAAGALLAVLAVSNLASLAVGAYAGRHAAYSGGSLDKQCAAHTTQYSPLLSDVDIRYSDVAFNGSFMEEDVYRRPGSPEVDAAWEALGVDYRAGVISAEDGPRSGLTSAHVQRADKYGGGFFVNVEGMHHLHCLNLLRKSLYYNYPYYKDLGTHAFKNDDHILQLHVSHCVDAIRQVLMCNVDTGVLGQVWYNPEHPAAFPDFHTTHRCKNYEAVRTWAEKLQAPPPDTLPSDYLKPANPNDIWPSTP